MFYFVIVLLMAALLSSAAAFAFLSLLVRRDHGALAKIAIKMELLIFLVLVVNFVGFLLESLVPTPDPRLKFVLMSFANIALGVMTWQDILIVFEVLESRKPAFFDTLSLIGIAFVYVVSVFFALFGGSRDEAYYDNRVGYMIPSLVSALVGLLCAIVVLRGLGKVEEGRRGLAKVASLAALFICALSIANETLPLASLLGLANLPLSPLLMIAMNALVIGVAWKQLAKDGDLRPEATAAATEVRASPGMDAGTGILFNEKSIEKAVQALGERYGLSSRESEIAAMVLAGHVNTAIADKLFISVFTVKNHIHSIFRKTGAESRIDLMRRADMKPKN